jgi:hypothetical protein
LGAALSVGDRANEAQNFAHVIAGQINAYVALNARTPFSFRSATVFQLRRGCANLYLNPRDAIGSDLGDLSSLGDNLEPARALRRRRENAATRQ